MFIVAFSAGEEKVTVDWPAWVSPLRVSVWLPADLLRVSKMLNCPVVRPTVPIASANIRVLAAVVVV